MRYMEELFAPDMGRVQDRRMVGWFTGEEVSKSFWTVEGNEPGGFGIKLRNGMLTIGGKFCRISLPIRIQGLVW